MITLTKITDDKMEITYNFNGTKVKRRGSVPQIGAIIELEEDNLELTTRVWKVVDVIHKLIIDEMPETAEHVEVVLYPTVYGKVESPKYVSTST